MNSKTFISLLGALLSVSIASADTIIPGGNVSGTWTALGSPYLIQGNITIHPDSMLTIEPGVVVNFQGGYTFTVNGLLEAVGTEADSIYFTASTSWTGIFVTDAPDSSHLVYCSFRNGAAPVNCNNSNALISHSTITGGSGIFWAIRTYNTGGAEISHCNIVYNGTGVWWSSSSTSGIISDCNISHNSGRGIWLQAPAELTIINCVISDNTGGEGAGVRATNNSTLNLINCTISNNSSEPSCRGGGVWCEMTTATLTNCTIKGNYAAWMQTPFVAGGGIGLRNANATLSYCTIYDNFGAPAGAGIGSESSTLNIDHCTIDRNRGLNTAFPGAGIRIITGSSTTNVTNSIISNNYLESGTGGYGIYNEGTLAVEYSDFYGHQGGDISGNIPAGFGILDTTNCNNDSCDCYCNLFMNPMFVDSANYDYHLLSGSPCIDAGDPTSPLDPDTTITDIGRYFYDQSVTGIGHVEERLIPNEFGLFSPCPNPFNASTAIRYQMQDARHVSLKIYDTAGRLMTTLVDDYRQAGIYEATFDGSKLASGIYLAKLQAGEFSAVQKLVLMK